MEYKLYTNTASSVWHTQHPLMNWQSVVITTHGSQITRTDHIIESLSRIHSWLLHTYMLSGHPKRTPITDPCNTFRTCACVCCTLKTVLGRHTQIKQIGVLQLSTWSGWASTSKTRQFGVRGALEIFFGDSCHLYTFFFEKSRQSTQIHIYSHCDLNSV